MAHSLINTASKAQEVTAAAAAAASSDVADADILDWDSGHTGCCREEWLRKLAVELRLGQRSPTRHCHPHQP